jgi:hypothetical protein
MGNPIPIRIIGSLYPSISAMSRGWRKNLQFPLGLFAKAELAGLLHDLGAQNENSIPL